MDERARRFQGRHCVVHKILVRGTVQGVGFRPFIYRLALEMSLTGSVMNNSDGVVVHLGPDSQVDDFISRVRSEAPSASRIHEIEVAEDWDGGSQMIPVTGFHIVQSENDSSFVTGIPPDIALCDECLAEMRDPDDRRYGYPFINCTDCGPRYSIIRSVPYDRSSTTMGEFTMCEECEKEYLDPASRRFHAQPNACSECGPSVSFVDDQGNLRPRESALEAAREALLDGQIVAVKGLGGFHLACDATDQDAVERLRSRKRPSNKSFAVMLPDLEAAKKYCDISEATSSVLKGTVRPIVIMREGAVLTVPKIAAAVAPGCDRLGVMLPYTPIHHLLFDSLEGGQQLKALVMTSGNQADEPIAIGNDEAMNRLAGIADAFLLHDREIHTRVDDSIMLDPGDGAKPVVVRRARGFAPHSIELSQGANHPHVFAAGADLKASFCLAREGRAVLSQHIGDLQTDQSVGFFCDTLELLSESCSVQPRRIVSDSHPDYTSTRIADRIEAEIDGIEPTLRVQHHHAHIVSAMAEHGLTGTVIGIALDGTGFGPDGTVWGGEILKCDRTAYDRIAHLWPVRMPGGDKAALEPWRMALSYLHFADVEFEASETWSGRDGAPDEESLSVVAQMLDKGVNSPETSSAGRLFDAVAALTSICISNTFEGEAAILLQQAAERCRAEPGPYDWRMGGQKIDTRQMIHQIVSDIDLGRDIKEIALAFHKTMVGMVSTVAAEASDRAGLNRVVLSGGVFQNVLLSRLVESELTSRGIEVFTHEVVPSNDGGIALGQAAVAVARYEKEEIQ